MAEADAVVKGQTASSSYKPAIMDNGVKVMVPPHIEAGTRIVVSTASTGVLYAQIVHGAPFDILLAADARSRIVF